MKALASGLGVHEKKVLSAKVHEEEVTDEQPVSIQEETETVHDSLVKIINLSSVPFAWLPVANFLLPLLIMLFTKQKSSMVKQIISLQIFFSGYGTGYIYDCCSYETRFWIRFDDYDSSDTGQPDLKFYHDKGGFQDKKNVSGKDKTEYMFQSRSKAYP